MLAQPGLPSAKDQMGSRSSQVARLGFRVAVRYPRPDFRICKQRSAGYARESFGKSSFPKLPFKLIHFFLRQKPPAAWPKLFVFKGANANAAELFHRMTDRLKHSPDLLILALVECDLEPWVFATFQKLNRRWCQPLTVNVDSSPQTVEVAFDRFAGNLDLIDLFYVSSLCQKSRQLTIVREDD